MAGTKLQDMIRACDEESDHYREAFHQADATEHSRDVEEGTCFCWWSSGGWRCAGFIAFLGQHWSRGVRGV